MKKLKVFKKLIILFTIVSLSVNIFSRDNDRTAPLGSSQEANIEILLNNYKQDLNFSKKVNAIFKLAKTKNIKVLTIFIDDLCNKPVPRVAYKKSGYLDLIRKKIVIALRSYKNLSYKVLCPKFYSLRKLINNDPELAVVGESAITAALWAQKWKNAYKAMLIASITKRIRSLKTRQTLFAIKLVQSLRTVESAKAIKPLNIMMRMGFVRRVRKHIKKALRFYSSFSSAG